MPNDNNPGTYALQDMQSKRREELNRVWDKDAPDGYAYKCPDCGSAASLGCNAAFHAMKESHGVPTIVEAVSPKEEETQSVPDALKVVMADLNARYLAAQAAWQKAKDLNDHWKEYQDWKEAHRLIQVIESYYTHYEKKTEHRH